MRVFRPNRKSKTGQTTPYARWYIEFRDHRAVLRRLPGFTDKRQTEDFGRKVSKLVDCRMNGDSPDRTMADWLENMSAKTRAKLAEIGILDSRIVAVGRPLVEHIDDFERALVAKGGSTKHARQAATRARRLAEGCRFVYWNDISASKVEEWLADQRAAAKNISIQTSNFYLQAIKQFARWMVRDRRASSSPLSHLQGQNVALDRRHDRRALSVEELRWLLEATERGPERAGIRGAERRLVYLLAVETGLRANEIRSLKASSFDLSGKPATVTIEAAYSKRRRQDVVPLRPQLVQRLREHLAVRLPEAPAFTMPNKDRLAHVIRADLKAAREAWVKSARAAPERSRREATAFLAYRDESGRVADFHCLRHTFITNLANSGVHPKVAQTLARHSTITLTMDRYSHSVWEDLGDALAGLPDVGCPAAEPLRATGTTDGVDAAASVAFCVARNGAECNSSVQLCAVSGDRAVGNAERKKTLENTGNSQEIIGGSAWESNPPDTRGTCVPTVLKTAATTRCASTSARG